MLNQIIFLKYVFANGIAREIIYALLEEMDLRKTILNKLEITNNNV